MKRKIGLVSDEGLGDVWEGSEKRNPPLNGSGSETDRCRGRALKPKLIKSVGIITELQINTPGPVTMLATPSEPHPETRLPNYRRENQILCLELH